MNPQNTTIGTNQPQSATYPVPGTWGIGGVNLPDFGLTELLTGGQGGSTFNNPAVYQAVGTTQPQYAQTVQQNQQYASGQNPYAWTPPNNGNVPKLSPATSPPGGGQPQKPAPNPGGPGFEGWNSPLKGTAAGGHNVGDVVNGWRWNGNFWEPPQGQNNAPDITGEVNNAYNEAQGFWNNIYDQTANPTNQQNFINQYTQQIEAQRPGLQQAFNTGNSLIDTQKNQAQQQSLSALDEAKRLFGEVSQGVRQRFGGVNSAGDFANQFYNRELQRQSGQINNTLGQNLYGLQNKQQDLQSQLSTGLQKIDEQKAAAQSQAQAAFQQQLNEINAQRGALAGQKAQQQLLALQNYRQQAAQIQLAHEQMAQQLQQSILGVAAQLQGTSNSLAAYGKTPMTLQEQLSPIMQLIGGGQIGGGNLPPTPTGYYDPTRRDQNGNPIV